MLTFSRETERVDRVNRFNGLLSHKRADYKTKTRPQCTLLGEQRAQTLFLKSKLRLDNLFLDIYHSNVFFFYTCNLTLLWSYHGNVSTFGEPYKWIQYHSEYMYQNIIVLLTITAPWYCHSTFLKGIIRTYTVVKVFHYLYQFIQVNVVMLSVGCYMLLGSWSNKPQPLK